MTIRLHKYVNWQISVRLFYKNYHMIKKDHFFNKFKLKMFKNKKQ